MKYPLIKKAFLLAARAAGLFSVARFLTRKSVRILCYHGVSSSDEHLFRPPLFIEPLRLKKRLDFLKKHGYPVVSLDVAMRGLEGGACPENTVVITIDDGFHQVWQLGVPEFLARGLPVTIYVTTYHVEKNTPIFRLALRYILWKSRANELDCNGLDVPWLAGKKSWRSEDELEIIASAITAHAEKQLDEPGRQQLLKKVADGVKVDYEALVRDRLFTIMSADEIRDASSHGIDIQLHTHRHRLPAVREGAISEIYENRVVLEPLVTSPLVHLCYPSGIYCKEHLPWLRECGIRSATTCDPGFNTTGCDPLRLRRFLDSSVIPDIVFEAEICGFLELLRRLFKRSR